MAKAIKAASNIELQKEQALLQKQGRQKQKKDRRAKRKRR